MWRERGERFGREVEDMGEEWGERSERTERFRRERSGQPRLGGRRGGGGGGGYLRELYARVTGVLGVGVGRGWVGRGGRERGEREEREREGGREKERERG